MTDGLPGAGPGPRAAGRGQRRDLGASIVRIGQKHAPLKDLYAYVLVMKWRWLLLAGFAFYLAINALFGALYYLVPGSIAHGDDSFAEAFFFSVETFCAIGYGYRYADGGWGHLVVTLQGFASILAIAFSTGLVFAKFSQPHSRILFSDRMVVERRNGVPTLSFRLANERHNDAVVEASIRVSALLTVRTKEGAELRRLHDLELERSQTPLFLLSWQVFHRIDEGSPLHGWTADDLWDDDVRFVVALVGLDSVFQQTVHARRVYFAEDVAFGHRFVDVLRRLDGGRVEMDYRRFHGVEPDPAAREERRG
ncbi:MAG: ion channel [Sandaracinaceae bacterium]